jgi:hypothetical protein
MAQAQCPYCGAELQELTTLCPVCRESLEQAKQVYEKPHTVEGGRQIRRGMMWMWLAALLFYFAGDYSPLRFPLPQVSPLLTQYLLPFVFLGGLGMVTYGLFLRSRG